MRGATCLFSTRTALRRVFMTASLEHSTTSTAHATTLFAPALFSAQQTRSASFPIRRVGQGNEQQAKYKLGRLPRDQEIRYPWVQVTNLNDQEGLSEPMRPRDVLANLDLKTYSLIVVALPNQEAPEKGPPNPICKIVNRKEQQAAKDAKAKQARKKEVFLKELELNWAIAPHDLDHRLKQLKTFLEKGMRVQVLLLKKARKRPATNDEAKEVLRRVREAAEEVAGTKEWKATEGELMRSMRIFLEGPKSAST